MSEIMVMITEQLGGSMMQQMASKLGGGNNSEGISRATAMAVPMIMAALKRNSSSRSGAESLASALDKGHAGGDILDNLTGMLGGSSMQNGSKILGHVFAGKQGNMASQLGKASGLGSEGAGDLMSMLAPMVMGALGKAKQQSGAGVSGLQDLLRNEQQSIQKRQPKQFVLIEGLLDSDGDVDLGDILQKGSGLLGGFFKR